MSKSAEIKRCSWNSKTEERPESYRDKSRI